MSGVVVEEIVVIEMIVAIEVIVAIAIIVVIGLILNFCDAREQLSLLKLPSKAKIMSVANNSQFSILNSPFSILHGWKFDAEGGAEAEFGAFYKDFAFVVFFDDAFGE